MDVRIVARNAREAGRKIASLPTEKKNALPESSKSPGKVTLLEEESALGKREEN